METEYANKEKIAAVMAEAESLYADQQFAEVAAKLNEAAALSPVNGNMFRRSSFMILLTAAKDYDGAYAYLRSVMSDAFWDDAGQLNEFAWAIAASDGVEQRDFEDFGANGKCHGLPVSLCHSS